MNRLRKPLAGTALAVSPAPVRSALAGCLLVRKLGFGSVLAGCVLVGCSDAQRIPDGERFSDTVTGVPGVFLIDDMEDGSQYLLSDSGFTGLWYIYNDASLNSVQEPSLGFPMYQIAADDGTQLSGSVWPPRPCGSTPQTPFFEGETPEECQFVARTWGTGQRGWGAGVGLDLNGEGGAKNPVDASRFGGIGFYAIGDIRDNSLRVNVQDVRTTPESAEAADRRQIRRCTDTPTDRCNDHFGTTVTVTTAWTWIEIPFSCMTPGGWGYPGMGAPFLSTDVVGIQFQILGPDPADTGMPTMAPVRNFDFAIDNLSFLDASRVATPPVCPGAP
jgi:hypothetical protein